MKPYPSLPEMQCRGICTQCDSCACGCQCRSIEPKNSPNKNKIPFKLESIYKFEGEAYSTYSERVKVFGGWLVKNESMRENCHSESMVFVPDPNHEWEV